MREKRELTEDQQTRAIELALTGISMLDIAKQLNMHAMQFMRYRKRYPQFELLLSQAREEAIEHLVASVTDLADVYDNPNQARVKFETIKWRAAVTDPNRYGDRMQLDVNQHIDLTSILTAAQSRLSPLLESREVTEIDNADSSTDISELE